MGYVYYSIFVAFDRFREELEVKEEIGAQITQGSKIGHQNLATAKRSTFNAKRSTAIFGPDSSRNRPKRQN